MQKDHIDATLPELIEETDFTVKVEKALTSENVLSKEDVQIVRAEKTKYAIASQLYSILQKRTLAYRVLATAFYNSQQSGAVLILLKGLFWHLAEESGIELDKNLLNNINEETLLKKENWEELLEYLQSDPPLHLDQDDRDQIPWFRILKNSQKRNRYQQRPSQSKTSSKRSVSGSDDEGTASFSRETALSKRQRVEVTKGQQVPLKGSRSNKATSQEGASSSASALKQGNDGVWREIKNAAVTAMASICQTRTNEGSTVNRDPPILRRFVPGIPFPDEVDKPFPFKLTRPRYAMTFKDDYGLPCKSKGLALIVNIRQFDKREARVGADLDVVYMKNLWHQLGYEVYYVDGRCTKQDFENAINEFTAIIKQWSTISSSVIYIGSHGSYGKFETSDHKLIDVHEEVIPQFYHEDCCTLIGKPKLFFVQACQNFPPKVTRGKDELAVIDDTMLSFSTIPGTPAWRDFDYGSIYTYCLTKVFMESACTKNLSELLDETQKEVRKVLLPGDEKAQVPMYSNMGIGILYFNIEALQTHQYRQ